MTKMAIEEQNQLLAQSAEQGVRLSELLARRHYSYDNLRYADGLDFDPQRSPFPPIATIDELPVCHDGIPAVSFFSGAGGMDVGFRRAGFRNIIGIEHTELFCQTLRHNNPGQLVIGPPAFEGDVSKRDEVAAILRQHGVREGFNGVFHGGPPCQSFSKAANQRFSSSGEHFKRTGFDDAEKGTLIFDYIWYIRQFRPLAFLIENVSGIIACDHGGRISQALDDLRAIGYSIPQPGVVDATLYGVPQRRKRWIAVGTRGRRPIAIPAPGAHATPCGHIFTLSLEGVPNHVTRKHRAESVARYSRLEVGGRDLLGRVDRLDPLKPSKTVIAGGASGGGRSHLHPFTPRTLSVRECARLQTFPDDYEFIGPPARQFTQVGNAVPPMLAYRFALAIKEAILPDYLEAL